MTAQSSTNTARQHTVADLLAAEARTLHEALDRLAASDSETTCLAELFDLAEQHRATEEAAMETARLRARLDDVCDALPRLDRGEWGRCETCGEEIPAERLEILPTTTSCVIHARP